MHTSISIFLEKHFSWLVIFSIAVGLFVPGADGVPPILVPFCLALLIFVSAFQLELDELQQVPIKTCAILYVVRFLCLPVVLYYLMRVMFPAYDTSVLLFALMPTGVAAPAVTMLFGGNVGVSLGLLSLSSLLSPVSIPLIFYFVQGEAVSYDYAGMFFTLVMVVVLPIILHLPFRRLLKVVSFMRSSAKSLSTLLVALIMILVVGASRKTLFSDLSLFGESLFLTTLLFGVYYFVGWTVSTPLSMKERLSMTVSSGVNNNALGIGIASIHFSPSVALFFVVSELPWIVAIAILGRLARKLHK